MDERDAPRRRPYDGQPPTGRQHQAPDAHPAPSWDAYYEQGVGGQVDPRAVDQGAQPDPRGYGDRRAGYASGYEESPGYGRPYGDASTGDARTGDPRAGAQFGGSRGGVDPRYGRRAGLPADRGGSGPHFYGPGPAARGGNSPLPDLRDDYDYDDEDERPSKWRRRTALGALAGGAAALIGGGAYAVSQFLGDGTRPVSGTDSVAADGPPKQYVDQNESFMGSQAGMGVKKNTPATGRSFATPSEAARNTTVTAKTVLPTNDPVRHLASRLTFGITPKVVGDIKKMGIDGWINQQLKPDTIAMTRGEQKLASDLVTYGMSIQQLRDQRDELDKADKHADQDNVKWTIGKQIWSDRQLFEMVVDFFNDYLHVAAYKDGNEQYRAAFDRDVIRKYAFDNYPDMLVAANRHPALLNYLDQPQSSKDKVNENLARENLELYSVGANNGYNEVDVRQAALLQTGRSIRDGQYYYRPEAHYVGPVKIMGFAHPNPTPEGGEAVQEAYFRYLALHPNTARYLAQNMATRFVSDVPPKTLVDAMAAAYIQNKGKIVPVIMAMLRRTEFWGAVGQKVRRPGEYFAATYRVLGVAADAPAGYTTNNPNRTPFDQGLRDLHGKLEQLGHLPMALPTPNGYADVFIAWTSAGTMVNLWNEAHDVLQGNRRMFTYAKPEQLLGAAPPVTAGAYLDALAKRLVFAPLTTKEKTLLLQVAGVQAATPVDATFNGAIAAVARTLLASPKHHLR